MGKAPLTLPHGSGEMVLDTQYAVMLVITVSIKVGLRSPSPRGISSIVS